MIKRTLLIWVVLLTFGFASMPVLGYSLDSKQAGNTEVIKPKKKSSKKHSKKHSKKTKKGSKKNSKSIKNKKGVSKKHKKGSKKNKSAGRKHSKKHSKGKHSKYTKHSKGKHSKYSKNRKHRKGKHSKKNRHSRRSGTVRRKTYSPPNSGNVEYRNYKRNSDGTDNNNSDKKIEKIAPPKEIKKEPKKEGDQ